MGAITAKSIRLIDILGKMNDNAAVLIVHNNGRSTTLESVREIRKIFKPHLGDEVKSIGCNNNIQTVYI